MRSPVLPLAGQITALALLWLPHAEAQAPALPNTPAPIQQPPQGANAAPLPQNLQGIQQRLPQQNQQAQNPFSGIQNSLPNAIGAPNQTSPADPSQAAPGSFVDGRLPSVDSASGMIQFNGQSWSPTNNALFASRFEKFLNTPEETGEAERDHRTILNQVIALLDPNNLKPSTITDAYRLLNRAASFPGDARLCDSLSNAIYTVWQSKRNQARLSEANRIMEEERKVARRNMEVVGFRSNLRGGDPSTGAINNIPRTVSQSGSQATSSPQTSQAQSQNLAQEASQGGAMGIRAGGYAEKVVGNAVKISANEAKAELSELQAKLEFQGLLVQLFFQRRFHHLVIGSRFYRALFSDGDSKLNLPDKSKQLIGNGGSPPTIATLETLANEAMKDVQLSVRAFHSLIDQSELDSATKRLTEAFVVGEFMPEVRTLPLERKRKILGYAQKSNQLLGAISAKDYTVASELIGTLKSVAKDFDATKPSALIETARNVCRLHLAKAKNAAITGDKAAFEAALAEAGKVWPNNPELMEVASKTFTQGDAQAQAINELDQLIAQKNFRRIADEAGRFLAATHLASAEKKNQLKTILEDFRSVEASLMGAKEMDRQGNPAGAWETVERMAQKFPDDLQLAQARALYTTRAADFVRTIQNAQQQEKKGQEASSLALFLKAQKIYPKSDLAEESIQRLKASLISSLPQP